MTRTSNGISDANFRILGLILLGLSILVFSPPFAHFYTEYLWFDSLDYRQVFTRRILAAVELAGVAIVISVGFLILNWSLVPHWIAPKAMLKGKLNLPTSKQAGARQVTVSTRPMRLTFTIGALILGALIGLGFANLWDVYLLARESVPTNVVDPIFGRDLSLYILQLPWYQTLLARAQVLVALAIVGLIARYLLFGQMANRGVTAHLSLLGSLWLALVGIGRLLARFALLQSNGAVVAGAGYTDIHARLPIYNIEAVLFFAAALVLVVNLVTRQWQLLVAIGLFWVGLSLVAPLYPAMVQQFHVEPNEFMLERPYIEHNIAFTRLAYGLDQVNQETYSAAGTLTAADLEAYSEVIRNVRLWDYRPLKRTYSELQEMRLYYTFNDIDIDRYTLDDSLTQVMLSARELDVDTLPEQAQTWINRHLVFTHGYGVAMNSVNRVTPAGMPEFLIQDIPPRSSHPALQIDRPGIYFGERTHTYALINTTENEFDYPAGSTNVYTRYDGPDGVRLGGPIRRALLATRFGNTQLLISSALSSESRILFHRTIQDRAATIAPMLRYDDDPYPVVSEGRIVWLLDAYTWADRFPYSEPVEDLNYIRNSIKVTIDAYTGRTDFYLIDPDDPVAATYAKIFPSLFQPIEAMPAELRAHWRYPESLFLHQSRLYATYHMQDPQVFYNREDLWDIPQELVGTQQQQMEPYYVTMILPNSSEPEFLLIQPYVPSQRQNMVAWFFARCDGDNYGELGVFVLDKDRLTYGPLQIEGRIDQNPLISQQLSLWTQPGSHVLRGNLLVIPVQDTFLYIEPLYLEAESSQLPELRRVIVAYGDRIAMAPSLDLALLEVFEDGAATVVDPLMPPGSESLEDLASRAWQHYQAAQVCLSEGDWMCYGQEQAQLERLLRMMADETD